MHCWEMTIIRHRRDYVSCWLPEDLSEDEVVQKMKEIAGSGYGSKFTIEALEKVAWRKDA